MLCHDSACQRSHDSALRTLSNEALHTSGSADPSDCDKDSMEGISEAQNDVCQSAGAAPDPPSDFDTLGIALETLHLEPLNGLATSSGGRHVRLVYLGTP